MEALDQAFRLRTSASFCCSSRGLLLLPFLFLLLLSRSVATFVVTVIR